MNRANIILLASVAALQVAEGFTPVKSSSLQVPCGCSKTQVSLFRKKKNYLDDEEDDDSSSLNNSRNDDSSSLNNSRRTFLSTAAVSATLLPLRGASASSDKQLNLSNEELRKIIYRDMVDNAFLVSADITRSVYDESAVFTDEIDEYTMDKWIKGTKSLFISSGSRVSLVGDIDVSSKEVTFLFDEDLMFNIPFKPVCSLTGKVVLTRDENTGLITSYREYWDQSVNEVLKSAKFGKKA